MDAQDLLSHGALAAVIIIVVLKEVPVLLRSMNAKKNGNGNSSEIIKRTEFEAHKRTVQYKDNCLVVVEMLKEQHRDLKDDLREVKSLIKNGHSEL